MYWNVQEDKKKERKRERIIPHVAWELVSLESAKLKPNEANIQPKSAELPVSLLTAIAFNRLGQYASSPRNRAHCYTELAVSFLAVAVTMTSIHYAYPRKDGQAESA